MARGKKGNKENTALLYELAYSQSPKDSVELMFRFNIIAGSFGEQLQVGRLCCVAYAEKLLEMVSRGMFAYDAGKLLFGKSISAIKRL